MEEEGRLPMSKWAEFSNGVNPRFLMPIHYFSHTVTYMPLFESEMSREILASKLMKASAAAVIAHPMSELSNLKIEVFTSGNQDNQAWAAIVHDTPVYGFTLQASRSVLQISQRARLLRDFIDSQALLTSVLWNLFPTGPDGGFVDAEHSLVSLGLSPIREATAFEQRVALGAKIGDETYEMQNPEIFGRLVPLKGGGDGSSPIGLLQIDGLLRGDLKLGFNKEIGDRPRQCWVSVDTPHNVTQREVVFKFEHSTGDADAPMKPFDLADLGTPVVAFFKDLILARLYPALFHDIQVAPGL